MYAVVCSLIALFFALATPAHLGAVDIIVTNLADSGPGSLRQAIADVPVNGTIGFAVEGDIVLTSGELLVDKPLRIFGGHQSRIAVHGNPSNFNLRVFQITAGPVAFSDLTIQGGNKFLIGGEDSGGGIFNAGHLTLRRVTIRNNRATFGGGLYNDRGATVTIINSTVSGNTALDPGICDGGFGGGIFNAGGVVNLLNTTITDNDGQCQGGGIWMTSGSVMLNNTIVARQSGPFPNDCDEGFPETGEFISRGFNLDSDDTCGLDQPSDLPGVDPMLGPLQDNGGRTDTHLPMLGSPAIDAGDTATAPPRDQRGVRRPQGPASDIGSVEVELP
jgi:hypothetical protein